MTSAVQITDSDEHAKDEDLDVKERPAHQRSLDETVEDEEDLASVAAPPKKKRW
jgi:hypothetical protein